MTGTLRTDGAAGRFPHLSLNSDGRPHPLLNAASVFTLSRSETRFCGAS
jgi:hypothetical protein